jgi:hypothetical protein
MFTRPIATNPKGATVTTTPSHGIGAGALRLQTKPKGVEVSEVDLLYQCPIYVTVDTDNGKVTDVQIGDESVTLDITAYGLDSPEVASALAIAENTDWPEWRFG